MRVAHVLPWISRNAGGLFYSVSGLAKATAALGGTHVEAFAVRDAFSEEDRRQWHPLRVHTSTVWGPGRLCYTPAMARIVHEFRPDIVHSAAVWTYQAAVVNRLHDRGGVPYVLSTRGTLDPWALRLSWAKKALALALFQQRHFSRAACIHALHVGELASIRAYGLKNPVCVIPNGVDLPEIDRLATEVAGRLPVLGEAKAGGRKVLLYLGRIHPKKGLVNLLRAWSEVERQRSTAMPDWLLTIAGWDEAGHRAELLRLCDELELRASVCLEDSGQRATGNAKFAARDASVVFLGPQYGQAKDACYRQADAFVLPSFSEGLPVAVLEAWSYGKPVLMTPECNLPQGFDANAALRIEAAPESIAQGLRDLFQATDSTLQSMGANGRRLVAEVFAWPKIARDMKAVYDWVLGGGPPPPTVHP